MSKAQNTNLESTSTLTNAQKVRIERNRVKAEHLRQAKLVIHPSNREPGTLPVSSESTSIIKVQGTKYIDSGGGFLVEQELSATSASTDKPNPQLPVVIDDAIAIPVSYEECLECGDQFADSFLFNNFEYSVCDKCRKNQEDKYSLITRTEAKAEYLLKDCDFDKREPPLRYISRKNPHNIRWGEMKLYLHLQVKQRAMDVCGSEEELLSQHESREDKRIVGKVRRYNKQMKQLRMEVRSSVYTKKTTSVHTHEFGADSYNAEDDTYTHSCISCPYSETYEKM